MRNYKIKVTPEESREVQEILFEAGLNWTDGQKTYYRSEDLPNLGIEEERICHMNDSMYEESSNEEISAQDFIRKYGKDKMKAKTEFEIGDRVRIIDVSQFSDYRYEECSIKEFVLDDGMLDGMLNVRVVWDNGGTSRVSKSNLKMAKTEEKPEFKVGDTVKVINVESDYYGETGTIEEVDNFGPGTYDLGDSFSEYYDAEDLELVSEKKEYKIGDKIKITGRPSCWASGAGGNYPLSLSFPQYHTIEEVVDEGSHISIKADEYGYDLSHLKEENLIELVEGKTIIGCDFAYSKSFEETLDDLSDPDLFAKGLTEFNETIK